MDRKRSADEAQGAPLKKMKVDCKAIALQANCFPVTVGGDVEYWYEYTVNFEPVIGADATRLKRALLHSKSEILQPSLGFFLFTGTNLYSPELVAEPIVVDDATSRVGVIYTITITHTLNKIVTAELSQPMKALINTALRRRMFGELSMVDIRRLMFLRTPPGEKVFKHKSGQVTVLQGYSTAISDDYQAGLHLNIDVKSKVQHLSTLLTEMADIMQRHQANSEAACNAELEGRVFMTKYARRSYRIERVDFSKTPRDTFKRKNGTELTYLDYYRDTYSERITELDQPLVEVKTRKRRRTDRALEGQQPAQPEGADPEYEYLYFVPELLYLTGLSTEMRNDAQFKGMVNLDSKLSGTNRKAQIEKFVGSQLVPANNASETALAKAGVEIDKEMLKLNGFVFSEKIIYGDQKPQANVSAGDWQQDYYKHAPFRGVSLTHWLIVCPSTKMNVANDLNRLFRQAISKGLASIAMDDAEIISFVGDPHSPQSYINAVTPYLGFDPKPQIVLFIMPSKFENVYEEVKAFLGKQGIPQQAVLASTMESGGQPAKATKILAQMACKMGGALWKVENPYFQDAPTMVVGIDISPDTKKNKNVLGFCATLDPDFSSYFIKVAYFDRQGRQGVDVVSSQLVELLESAIEAFYQKNDNTMPANIVLYRSGVSDGMLHAVATSEIAPILERLQLISAQSGEPVSKLTYVIIRNRINMRFFYTQGKNGNPTPGTIVDEAVVFKDGYIRELVGGNDGGNSYDFFMCAQNVKEGTVGPTHYLVAYDSIQTDRNEFQHFTFKLCHLYYNWTGTVKIPAPVMYAQKAAKQVAQYLHSVPEGLDEKQWCI